MLSPHNLQAVIFDIDGTIIDTEKIQSDSYLKVLKEHGVLETELNPHGTVHIPGEETSATWHRLKTRHGIETDISELSQRKRQATMDALCMAMNPMPGFMQLITELRENNVKVGLASSAKRERVHQVVAGLGLEKLIDVTVSADDVEQTKPAPEPYLIAASTLKIDPANCVVIEDADVGIESAKAAGMKTVAVPNKYTQLMDFSNADLRVASLTELSFKTLSALVSVE